MVHPVRARLLLPVAVGLAMTGTAAVGGNAGLALLVALGGPYVVGRMLWTAPLGHLVVALLAGGALAALVDPSEPWWWSWALLPIGLVSTALPASIGQLQGRRAEAGADDQLLLELKARVGALVSLISILLVGVLLFVGFGRAQLEDRADAVRFRLGRALAEQGGTGADHDSEVRRIAAAVDAPLVESSWHGDVLRLGFEVRIGLLPTHCVRGVSTEWGWDTDVAWGPCR